MVDTISVTLTAPPATLNRSSGEAFDADMVSWLGWHNTQQSEHSQLITELNSAITGINTVGDTATNAVALADASASLAAASIGAIAWVSGTTYNTGDVRYSPANFLLYRRKIGGGGTTDPSQDTTNWAIATVGVNARRTTVASSATPDIWADSASLIIDFTGAATVVNFTTAPSPGAYRILHCAGACTFQSNANIAIEGNSDLIVKSGDIIRVHAITTSTFRVESSATRLLSIFSAQAASKIPLSIGGQNLTSQVIDQGLPSGVRGVVRSSTLFVANSATTSSNVATSSDGKDNWVLRTMPSSAQWKVGASAGSDLLAVVQLSTTAAKSTDGGLTWSSVTNTSTSSDNNVNNVPVENGGYWIIDGSTASTATVTSDLGTSWVTAGLPADNGMDHFLAVGGLFWYWSSGTAAYTSPTGLTGTWTLRSMPFTPVATMIVGGVGEDAVYASAATASSIIYKTTDGINWVDSGFRVSTSSTPTFLLNGVAVSFTISSANSYIQHGSYKNPFWSEASSVSSNLLASDGAGTIVVPFGLSGTLRLSDTEGPYGVFK